MENQGRSVSDSLATSSSRTWQSPVARKAPLQQSSSEEESNSDVQSSGDSLVGELQRKKKAQRKVDPNTAKSSMGSSRPQPKTLKTTASEVASKASTVREKSKQQLTVPAVATKPVAEKDRSNTITSKPTDNASSKRTSMRAIRTTPQKQINRAINFIDRPKEQQRKEWSTDHLYNKLKFRGLAEKRSRTEGTPDFSVLNFVNGPPPTLPKATASRPNGDPYGRRDITNRRVQEEDPDDRPRQGFGQDIAPLADWEADKVPLMCNAWKLSSNCPYGARKCRFMHRAFDPQGRPYQLGDYDGRVPQKYRKPPITCLYWYYGDRCKKTAEECLYAHKDTGWTEYNGQPIQIEHLPPDAAGLAARDAPTHLIPFKLQDPPITCSFWLREPYGCNKTEEACKYTHWNTGWALPEHDTKGPPVRIDPNLRPRGGPPKSANPPVACPFWLRSETGCSRTDDECKYAHWNTGWAPPGLSGHQALPINPRQLPLSQSPHNEPNVGVPSSLQASSDEHGRIPERKTVPSRPRNQANKSVTCSSWLRDPDGCSDSEEACKYAHRNTGWATPKGRPFDPPVALDPNQIPRFQLEQRRNGFAVDNSAPKNRNPPITCYFWLENPAGCAKTAEACRFAHRNTGWISAIGAFGAGKRYHPEQIDPRKLPLFREPGKCFHENAVAEHVAVCLTTYDVVEKVLDIRYVTVR